MTPLLFKWVLKSRVPWWFLFYREAKSQQLTKTDFFLFSEPAASLWVTAIISVCGFIIPWKFCNLLNHWASPCYSPCPGPIGCSSFQQRNGVDDVNEVVLIGGRQKMLGKPAAQFPWELPQLLDRIATFQSTNEPHFCCYVKMSGRNQWLCIRMGHVPIFTKTITTRKINMGNILDQSQGMS